MDRGHSSHLQNEFRNCTDFQTSGGDGGLAHCIKLRDVAPMQKNREGCGRPKFLAGKVFRQISTLLDNSSPNLQQHEMLFLSRFGDFPARKCLHEHRPRLWERSWIFSSETTDTVFLSFSDEYLRVDLRP